MIPDEPCIVWRDGNEELWLPDTPLGRKIVERLQRQGAQLVWDPRERARNGNGTPR